MLVSNYPTSDGGISLMYVHVRCLAYAKAGINVEVLNLSAKRSDVVDGISVITLNDYLIKPPDAYEILILHAANIRQHMRFLKAYGKRFARHIFFFHGHEVLRINKVYAKDYPYLKKTWEKKLIQDIYDTFKLWVWRRFFTRNANKTTFVFVSHWMMNEFLKWTKTPRSILEGRYHIIYNAINQVFEENQWKQEAPKKYDFITIRGNWDGAKYGIDIVNDLAKNNPDLKFLLVGKGSFFEHYQKAENLTLLKEHLSPREMLPYLDMSRCALMPTRTDAQGLMMCEMASYGMPVISSDIPVCREVFNNFPNISLIDNEEVHYNIKNDLLRLEVNYSPSRSEVFHSSNTVDKEVHLLKE